MGPARNIGGWHAWWTARDVASTLTAVPDGSTIDLAIVPRLDHDPEINPGPGARSIAEQSPPARGS